MSIEQKRENHKQAALELMAEVAKEYPIGKIVIAEIGGHMMRIEITGHSTKVEKPEEIYGFNKKTKAKRKFTDANVVKEDL